jgi:hypothetical protein
METLGRLGGTLWVLIADRARIIYVWLTPLKNCRARGHECLLICCTGALLLLLAAPSTRGQLVAEGDDEFATTGVEPGTDDTAPTGLGVLFLEDEDLSVLPAAWVPIADDIESSLASFVHAQVARLDRLFAHASEDARKQPRSSLSLAMHLTTLQDEGTELRVYPDYKLSFKVPNLERQAVLFIRGSGEDELPGEEPGDRDNRLFVGVQRGFDWGRRIAPNLSVGIKMRVPPEPFVMMRFSAPSRSLFGLTLKPSQSFYWYGEEGFGEKTTLRADRWFSEKFLVRSVSAMRWSEETDGGEWEQSVIVGHLSHRRSPFGRRAHRALATRYSLFGHTRGPGVDRHRVQIMYRRPLHKTWLYLEVVPQVEFPRSDDWDPEFSVRLSVIGYFTRGTTRETDETLEE